MIERYEITAYSLTKGSGPMPWTFRVYYGEDRSRSWSFPTRPGMKTIEVLINYMDKYGNIKED